MGEERQKQEQAEKARLEEEAEAIEKVSDYIKLRIGMHKKFNVLRIPRSKKSLEYEAFEGKRIYDSLLPDWQKESAIHKGTEDFNNYILKMNSEYNPLEIAKSLHLLHNEPVKMQVEDKKEQETMQKQE